VCSRIITGRRKMLTGALLGLATAMAWGTSDFLSRKSSTKIGSILTAVLIQPVGLLIMTLVVVITAQDNLAPALAAPPILALNFVAGALALTGILFLYRGYAAGVMSIVAPIASAFPIVTVTLSVLLLGTILTPIRSVSIIAAILGMVLAGVRLSSLRSGKSGNVLTSRKIVEGADDGLGTLICAGILLFSLGIIAPVIGSLLAVVIVKLSETIIGIGIILSGRVKLARPDRSTLGWIAIIGATDASGFVAYNYAVTSGSANLPIIVTLAGLNGVVTVILARVFYKERLEKIQLVGVVIIFVAGAALLYF